MPPASGGPQVGMTPSETDSPAAIAPISAPVSAPAAKPISNVSNPTQPSGTPIKVTATPISASVASVTSKPVSGRPHSAQLQGGQTRTNLPNAESDLTAAAAPSSAPVTPSTATPVTTTSAPANSAKPTDPKPTAPNIATSAPSIPAQVPVSFAKVGDLVPQGPMFAGQPAQLSLPITNPNQVALNNVRAMLMIDGRQAQSEPIATLMPMETRTVIFQQVIVPQPGPHQVKIGIQLQRPDSRPQMGMFNQMLTVQAAPVGIPTQVSGLAAGARQPSVAPVTKAGATTVTPSSPLNRTNSATTPASTVATARPATDPSPATGSTAVAKKTPATTTEVNGNHRPELTLTSVDLSYSPTAAVVGQPVDFHVVVRNSSEAPAKVGTLILKLVSDGKLILMTQPAIQFSVAANATYQANWRAVMPTGTRIEFVASVSADGVEVPGRSQASILLKTQPPIQAPVRPGKRRP
jgi:hypothetical protein